MKRVDDHYTYRVTWSEEDEAYVGLCIEFPSLSWLEATPETALKGICNTVSKVIRDMGKNGEPIPNPISEKHYSGKFMVRITPWTHRNLALEAAEAGVSLNRLISEKLSQYLAQNS